MVVLDATIVNVALPHVQRALGFSGNGLEWVVNAYAITFGGLLLLGGRAGDILGRRRVFVFGLLLFSAASLLGGFATSQWWLLTARAVQGAGGAVIAPTALALITTNFPRRRGTQQGVQRLRGDGRRRQRGGPAAGRHTDHLRVVAVGDVRQRPDRDRGGGRGAARAGRIAPPAGPDRRGRRGHRHGGVALLVYGLSKAATGADGISHWGDAQVLASLTASVVLLVSFVLIEMRSSHPLLPMRVLADRNRSGAYLIMLCVATGLFGLFFFLTLFIQTVLGYSAIRSGIAYLPFAVGVVIASALASPLVARIGPRPLILAGSAMVAGGMFWFSRLTEHAGYASHLLGPQLVSSFGLGLVFVPLALVALHNVAEQDSGVASSLLNAAQQVGGAIGLALLGTVAWTAVANSVRTQVAHAAAAAAKAGRPLPKPGTPPPASIYDHALTVGFSRAFVVAAGIGLLALLIAIATIRVSRQELSGAAPAPQEPAPQPAHCSPRHRSLRHRSPGLCSGMRTEPPSPRRPVLAGSASRPQPKGDPRARHGHPGQPPRSRSAPGRRRQRIATSGSAAKGHLTCLPTPWARSLCGGWVSGPCNCLVRVSSDRLATATRRLRRCAAGWNWAWNQQAQDELTAAA